MSRVRRRRLPREVGELIEYLRRHGSASTDRLRREGFTLRVVYDAARSGAVRLSEHNEALVATLASAAGGSGSP
jgi:hypothetical protein